MQENRSYGLISLHVTDIFPEEVMHVMFSFVRAKSVEISTVIS